MKNYLVYTLLLLILSACNTHVARSAFDSSEDIKNTQVAMLVNYKELAVDLRFKTPEGYSRQPIQSEFGQYIHGIKLKPCSVPAFTYDGIEKLNPNLYVGVLNLEPLKKNVQFYANAILRLRAEHSFIQKHYTNFNFAEDIDTYKQYVKGDFSYKKFLAYLDYMLLNTSPNTIDSMLEDIALEEMAVGDLFYQSSHLKSNAVLVIDVAVDQHGNKLFLLAHSHYPGQDIQVLSNPSNEFISPWYENKKGVLLTPEWRFSSSDLKRFKK